MARELTKRQREVLDFIITSIRDRGYPPTIAEIGKAFNISSLNGVNDHLVALSKKGYIERSSKARGIRITEKAGTALYQHEVGMLPLLGRVAAGSPLLAEENVETHIPVSSTLMSQRAYALRVTGDSMIEDGILDGDVIIIDQDRVARTGDIVVALVHDEATVKHFHPMGEYIELRPANALLLPMRFPAREVQLQGVVVALQRTIH